MKRLIIFIFITIFSNFAFAEIYGYFNAQQTKGGLLIGVEIIDKKTKKVLNYKEFILEWIFPIFSLIGEKTFSKNIFYLKINNENLNEPPLTILKILDKNFNEKHEIKGNPKMIIPSVKIVKKINGLIYPVNTPIQSENMSFSVITKNFSSNELFYYWSLDGTFVSRKNEININELPKLSGLLEVRVTSQNNESAYDNLLLK